MSLTKITDNNLTVDADVIQQGWILDPASQMLSVKKQQIVKEQKLDPSKLQNLTEYVFYLEHWLGVFLSLELLTTYFWTGILVYQLEWVNVL